MVKPEVVVNAVYDPTDTVCLKITPDKSSDDFTGQFLSFKAGRYAEHVNEIERHNIAGHGIKFIVNTGGYSEDEITRINAYYISIDVSALGAFENKVKELGLDPSMVVMYGSQYDIYWFVKEASVSTFAIIQNKLAQFFNTGEPLVRKACAMRLPGYFIPDEEGKRPIPVQCVTFHPEYRYRQDQFLNIFGKGTIEKNAGVMKGSEPGLKRVLHTCELLQGFVNDPTAYSEAEIRTVISSMLTFKGGTELILKALNTIPDKERSRIQTIVNSVSEQGNRPLSCRKRYKCAKADTGGCTRSFPAALAHLPLTAGELREILAELPITGDAVEDMKAAGEFIEGYLYNQEPAVAEAFIDQDIKARFRLKTKEANALVSAYKRCAKRYHSSVSQSKKSSADMMPWYIQDEKKLRFMPGILAEKLAECEKVIYAGQEYYKYEAGVYTQAAGEEIERLIQLNMIPSETKKEQIKDTEYQYRLRVRKDYRELNPNAYIINVKNGLFNIMEDKLGPHTPEYCSTIQLAVNYDEGADCPNFKRFLEETMEGDMEQVALIQEMLGYALIPVQSAQKCFVLVGAASAGKSVLLKVINELLLGRENVSNVSWQALNERFKPAELFGKLANIFADLPTKNIDDNGIFKALVGEDYMTVEKKNRDPFSFLNQARLLFSCNSIPKNYGDRSEGFYRRLIIIRFNHAVPKDQRDPHLLDKFQTEADGIFMFALKGLKRLIDNDYVFSETEVNREELQKYREDSDSVLSFVRDDCIIDDAGNVESSEIYNTYKVYCEECGLSPCSLKTFIQQVKVCCPSVSSGVDTLGKRRVLKGIRLGDILA